MVLRKVKDNFDIPQEKVLSLNSSAYFALMALKQQNGFTEM